MKPPFIMSSVRDPAVWESGLLYDSLHDLESTLGFHRAVHPLVWQGCRSFGSIGALPGPSSKATAKPWPGDPLSPLVPPRGGVSGDHGAQSAWSLCLCWGKPGENTPSRYADSLMGAGEEVEARKCTLQTFQCSARNSIFSQQRFIHIYTSPNADRKVLGKKSWNCRGKLYVNAIK